MFQYAITLALNLNKIREDIDFPSTSKDWKKFECNNELHLIFYMYPIILKK